MKITKIDKYKPKPIPFSELNIEVLFCEARGDKPCLKLSQDAYYDFGTHELRDILNPNCQVYQLCGELTWWEQ